MSPKHNLPFKAGHVVEARSFIPGYRGSWFRCKVGEIGWKKGSIGCVLEYIDFPDEKKKWTKLYQKPPIARGKMKDMKRELMVRPCYPPYYQADQNNDSREILEVAVIASNSWKVGDLVDWWADNVYWCGEVIQLLDLDKAKIKLPDPPSGEGLTYDVQFKDIRPTLFWSPEQGWTVPVNQVDANRRCCARLIQPTIQGDQTALRGQNDSQMSTSELSASLSSHASASLSSPIHTVGQQPANLSQNLNLDKCDSVEASLEEHDSVKLDNCAITRPNHSEMLKSDDIKESKDEGARKRMKMKAEVNGCTESSDTIEASVFELEELLCKVKWLKMVLNHGSPALNTPPSWKFEENRVTSTPKPDPTTDMKEMK